MGKRRPKYKRYGRKMEFRLIRVLFDKPARIAKNRPRTVVPDYITPDLVYRGDDCSECGGPIVYHTRWDAACCPACNEWKEEKCSDPECMVCQNRPETPLTLEEWGWWMSGELQAREITAVEPEEAKRENKRLRRVNYLKANKKEKTRNEKRGIKLRNLAWRKKHEKWGTPETEGEE